MICIDRHWAMIEGVLKIQSDFTDTVTRLFRVLYDQSFPNFCLMFLEKNENSLTCSMLNYILQVKKKKKDRILLTQIAVVFTLYFVGSFSGCPKLEFLTLEHNALETLSWTVFSSVNIPGSIGRRPSLAVSLKKNSIQCNSSICWIREIEDKGWGWFWWERDIHCSNASTSCWEQGESYITYSQVALDLLSSTHY